ncbi:chloride channel protein [Marinomonas piezotolerans]|uniref:Chloride channel protein n=2 Tax=Marinomonas piezotolerans TaxID=2213058 RepID=A0A370U4J7_9GAMM|nr:chloride channel protein [Marinomonas piezotolerans]
MTALVTILQWFATSILPSHSENYEQLEPLYRFFLPVLACLILALMWHLTPNKYLKVGIPYVVERLNYHQGNLPILNAVVQFFGALVGLLGGLSIGKEGPAVHIGATFGSRLAQRFRLSHVGVDTLVACGVAGAIAAAFQTPLAGVLFAYEVIFHEYRLRLVLPVLLSVIVAMFISEGLLGRFDVFDFGMLHLPLYDIGMLAAYVLLVFTIVISSSSFYQIQRWLWRFSSTSAVVRFLFVGVVTGLVGLVVPEVLGGGYDSLNMALSGEQILIPLMVIVAAKVVLTSLSIGLGIPGGMIGPTFVIGGLIGAQVSLWVNTGMEPATEMSLFVLLGMAAMMATTFQAPLTAVVAMVEMTHTSQTIAPAIFVIVLSCTIIRILFHQDSIFVERLSALGLVSEWSPVQRVLRHHNVQTLGHKVKCFPELLHLEQARDFATNMIDYIAIQKGEEFFLVSVPEVLEQLNQLDLGPQPWLAFDAEHPSMDVLKALSGKKVGVVGASLSVPDLMRWLHEHNQQQVLVYYSSSQEYWLATSHRLHQMLFKD